MHLNDKLTLFCGSCSVSDYLQSTKSIMDELAINDTPVTEIGALIHIINSIGSLFKELVTPNKDDTYEWPEFQTTSSDSLMVLNSTSVPLSTWHNRLGHPSLHILQQLLKNLFIPISSVNLKSFSCESCLCNNNSHQLPFGTSTLTSQYPLDLVYSDVWGPAPSISSIILLNIHGFIQ
jgi:hypothetical protein